MSIDKDEAHRMAMDPRAEVARIAAASLAAERCAVVASHVEVYAFEGAAFQVADGQREGWQPVYRFFHKQQGSHFYSVSSAERERVNATLGQLYQDEGVAYYVPTSHAADIVIDA